MDRRRAGPGTDWPLTHDAPPTDRVGAPSSHVQGTNGVSPCAFTLVEVLIVILILAILGAIVVPAISVGGTLEARESALYEGLYRMRAIVQRYAVDHHGVYPGAATDGVSPPNTEACLLSQLAFPTNRDGEVSQHARGTDPDLDEAYFCGPYMAQKALPACPLGEHSGKRTFTLVHEYRPLEPDPSPTTAWKLNTATGHLICNNHQPGSNGVPCCDW